MSTIQARLGALRLPRWNARARRLMGAGSAAVMAIAALVLSRSPGLDGGSLAYLATVGAAFASWSGAISLLEDRPVMRLRALAWLMISVLMLASLGVLVRA
jgi:hypothetical protein